jgi:hypothetical protein
VASVDVRTRTTASIRTVDAAAFFGDELPALIAERADLAIPGARAMEVRSLAVAADGRTWVVAFDGDRLTVAEVDEVPDDVQVALRIDTRQLQDLVNDLLTPVGLLAGGQLDLPVGRLERLLDWWVVLRSLLDGRRAHVAGDIAFRDLDGGPLDLHQSFALDTEDERTAAAHFLAEAGFLHLRGMFDPADMAAISADMDAAATRYRPADGRSWWARTADGEQRLVRMQSFQRESPALERVLADERFQAIGGLTDDGHVHGKPGGNPSWAEALIKPIGVVEGISDVPWHKDCSLGSHSYRCCSLTVGISVTGADAESGQLRVVPGSHRAHLWPSFVRKGLDLPQLDLPTATGDVTVHLSCTLHMSQPPVTRERRVVYTDFVLPADEDAWDLNESQLTKVREAAPLTVSQRPGHLG